MRTALIATLGFDEKFCYRAILRHGIKEGDRVILITTQMVERVAKAYEWIRKLLETSYGDRVEVEVLQVELKSVEKAIREVADKSKRLRAMIWLLLISAEV
nr:CRISPR-associated CARF protein Csa3 [Archaeoglobus fulgidus]